MKTLQDVRRQLATGKFEFSRHAFRRVVERNISEQEIREAGTDAEPIEDYPEDKYSPSALLLGFTAGGRPLHFQVSFAETELTKIITIYEPNPNEWVDYRKTELAMFNCDVCGNTAARNEFVSEVFTIDGRPVLVEHIPAQICERCGEPTFSRETTERVRRLVHEARPARTVPLDVFALA